jgi:hypothetical protein
MSAILQRASHMKILYVLPEYGRAIGGIATFYDHLLPAIVKAGCEVDVCVAEEESQYARDVQSFPAVKGNDHHRTCRFMIRQSVRFT